MTVAQAQNELLHKLRLERAAPARPAPRFRQSRTVTLLALTCAACGWFVMQATDSPATVEAATPAQPSAPVPDTPAEPKVAPTASLQASGYVVARRAATVSARTTAAIEAVYVDAGSHVDAGEIIARLDDKVKRAEYELAISQRATALSRVAEARAALAAAQRRLARTTALARRQLASQAELDEADAHAEALQARLVSARGTVRSAERSADVLRLELENYVIRAPFAGVVTGRSAQRGEIVSPMSAGGGFTRSGIATLVDMGSLEVEVDVAETYISRVRPAQEVQVRLNAYPGTRYAGQVLTIIPTADRHKATIRVRIALIDPDAQVMPEMGVRVDFLEA